MSSNLTQAYTLRAMCSSFDNIEKIPLLRSLSININSMQYSPLYYQKEELKRDYLEVIYSTSEISQDKYF